jgi:hypothetical protein
MDTINVYVAEFTDGTKGLLPLNTPLKVQDDLPLLCACFYGKTLKQMHETIFNLDPFHYIGTVDRYVHLYGANIIMDADRLANIDRIKYATETVFTESKNLIDIVLNNKRVNSSINYQELMDKIEAHKPIYTMADIDQLYEWLDNKPRIVDIFETYSRIIKKISATYKKFATLIEGGKKEITKLIGFESHLWLYSPNVYFDDIILRGDPSINPKNMYECLELIYYTLQNRCDEFIYDMGEAWPDPSIGIFQQKIQKNLDTIKQNSSDN